MANLIDKIKNARIFTKFDMHWGYNNMYIHDGDQWKVAFITHKGLHKPTGMKELDVHLKIKKYKFGVSCIDYLEMNGTKLNGTRCWPTPTAVKDVCSFPGFTNFYRKFIGDCSNIAHPLIDLTKKNEPWVWNNSIQNAFNQLKNCFLTKLVFHLPDTSKP